MDLIDKLSSERDSKSVLEISERGLTTISLEGWCDALGLGPNVEKETDTSISGQPKLFAILFAIVGRGRERAS
jgi:hypothetical protein